MNDIENITDLWVRNPLMASHVRTAWRDLGKAIDELTGAEQATWVHEQRGDRCHSCSHATCTSVPWPCPYDVSAED